ncbi:hypothetical protein M9H77_35757 [Catharanthus roseus]|uniref:Uncharacterized protein n=1 Tax=Catharanthus roseus TaxID=4058 RepID=A0ACB9ZS30_CATRO|nr:hypothetical protein M9H77_35757 [Catharanthus roseus]
MAISENWQLFVHDRRHNHKIAIYNHSHAQVARVTDEQLKQTEQFMKSHVPPRNILRFFREHILVVQLGMMQGRNTVGEALCLSAQRGYTVFYRNTEDNNILSDIVQISGTYGPAPQENWLGTPDHLYVIANTFNLRVLLIAPTDARWMPTASIAGPMAISSRYTSQWVGRTLL